MLTNRTKSTYFTKDTAKMNFKDAIYFILKGLRKTMMILRSIRVIDCFRLTAALLKFQIQLTTENISDIIITKAIGSKQGRWYV